MTENLLSTPPSPEITNPLYIEQDNKKYLLVIKISGDSISFIASEPEKKDSLTYLRKMTLNEIKEKETKNLFMGINSCMEFYDYLKVMSDMKKLSIIQKEDKVTISFTVDYLFKKHAVDINLFSEKINLDSISDLYKEVITLKEKIKIISSSDNNNNDLKKEIDNLKDEIKELKIIIEPIV